MVHDAEAYAKAKAIMDKYWPKYSEPDGKRPMCSVAGDYVRSHIEQAMALELECLRGLLSAYVADETRFNRGEGEPYGSISTETGMRARAAVSN